MSLNPFRIWASLVVTLMLSTWICAQTTAPTTVASTAPSTQPATSAALKPAEAPKSAGQPAAEPATEPAKPAEAAKPTAPPDAPSWAQQVADLADQISSQDTPAVRTMLKSLANIRTFASSSPQSVDRLLGTISTAKLLGTHAYAHNPQTLASDLAADFQNAGDVVPESVRQAMMPGDKAVEQRANETAAAWITQVLQPTKSQSIGVLVFWPTDRRLPADTSARRAIFVLVKAQLINNAYVFQQITFGDPLESPR